MNLGLSYAVSCSLTTKQLYLKNCRKTLSENVKTTLKLSPTLGAKITVTCIWRKYANN